MSKLERTLARFEARVAAGDFYEAHQTLRTIASRHLRRQEYEEAAELISGATQVFLKAGQSGSASDLVLFLLEVYEAGSFKADDAHISQLVTLSALMDPKEPSLKNVGTAMNNWTIKSGAGKFGAPALHHVLGSKYAEGGLVYEAERYLVLGTSESLNRYVDLIWDWYCQAGKLDSTNSEISRAFQFFSRPTLNYLFIGNIAHAHAAQKTLLQRLQLKHEVISKNGFTMFYYPDAPQLNFLQLLVLACQTKNKELFQNLRSQYAAIISELSSALEFLGESYFGIVSKKQPNLLQDMMSGLLGHA